MNTDIRHPNFEILIDSSTELEQLASGFQFTEGPIWHAGEQALIFSDIPANTLYRWTAEMGISSFRQPSHKANGNTYDQQDRILSCEHATSRLTRADQYDNVEILASHFEGKELNSPNDVVVGGDGSIYFTDPPYGRMDSVGVVRDQQLAFQGVFRLDPVDGALKLLVDDFERPNGLCFSNDQQQLYIDDSAHHHIRRFDVTSEGDLINGIVWAELEVAGIGSADGMKIDSAGNVYCTGPGGIHIFDADATYLGIILMPEQTANLCFGDDDMRSLYITASTSIYRLRVNIPGQVIY